MNPVILFVGGLLLGVLISVGFILRIKDDNSAPAKTQIQLSSPSIAPEESNAAQSYASAVSVAQSPAVISAQTEFTYATSTSTSTVNPLEPKIIVAPAVVATNAVKPVRERPKWVPGKPGSFGSFDAPVAHQQPVSAAAVAQAVTPAVPASDVRPVVELSQLTPKERNQLKRQKLVQNQQLTDYLPSGAAAGGVLSKKLVKAAMQLKRKQQRNNGIDGTAGSVETSPLQPIAQISTSVVQSTVNANLAAVARVADIPNTVSATTVTNTAAAGAAKVNTAMASTYSTPAIQQAVTKYHAQSERDYTGYTPYIPTYSAAAAAKTKLPDMSLQKGEFEKENLKLHLCNSVYEAYSASYLTTKHHMLAVASETYNLTWVNCEMASFIHMQASSKFYHEPKQEGVIMQSLDVLDFSVIHLSAYERSSNKHRDKLWKNRRDMVREWANIDPVINAGKRLAYLNDPTVSTRKISYLPEAQRTVVVMPFLGGAMGAGHSKLNNRYEYLRTCFWSLYEYFPHIVAGVTRQEDVDWCMKESGMPFFEIILLPNLPKSAGLPVGLTQQTKLRLQDGRWDFDYVFFTESDQILISRELPMMYAHLKQYPGHMILPHRLMPYSNRVMGEVHKRDIVTIHDGAWATQSCCLPRQNCQERKTWLPVADAGVPVINYYGLYVPLGNVNFLAESYRSCKLSEYIGDKGYCP